MLVGIDYITLLIETLFIETSIPIVTGPMDKKDLAEIGLHPGGS